MKDRQRFGREVDLVLALLRPVGTTVLPSMDTAQLDIDFLRGYLVAQRVLPQVLARLRDIGATTGAAGLLGALSTDPQQGIQGLVLTATLVELTQCFAEHGIESIAYKGPVLALRLYGDVSMRPSGDIDILVRRRDAMRAHDILVAEGWIPTVVLSAWERAAFLRYEHDIQFDNARTGVHLELHWQHFDRYIAFDIDEDAIWASRIGVDVGGAILSALDTDLELITLALHGGKHGWKSLGWILDIAMLIVNERPDPERLRALAERAGLVRATSLALYLARELFGAVIPGDVLPIDAVGRDLARIAIDGPLRADRAGQNHNDNPHYYLRLRERRRDRIRYRWYWLFTPNIHDQRAVRLPSGLSALHYVIRPLRLVAGLLRRGL